MRVCINSLDVAWGIGLKAPYFDIDVHAEIPFTDKSLDILWGKEAGPFYATKWFEIERGGDDDGSDYVSKGTTVFHLGRLWVYVARQRRWEPGQPAAV